MSNPLTAEIHVEVMETTGVCSECKVEGNVFEFVVFLGLKPFETGKQFCKYCYEKLNDEKES